MPLYDEDGKVVENALTSEEAEAKAKAAAEAATEQVNTEKAKLEADLQTANAALAKANPGDKNWQELRTAKEDAEKSIADVTKRLDDREKKDAERLVSSRNKMFLDFVDGNTEQAKKLQLVYEQQTAGAEDSEENIRTRVTNAYAIFKNKVQAEGGMSTAAMSSGGGGSPKKPIATFSPEAQAFADKLGVTRDKVKKYNERHGNKGA